MLDIKLIRQNPEKVQKAAADKKVTIDINHILEIDTAYREFMVDVQRLREERNRFAKEQNIEDGKRIKAELEKKEHALAALKVELDLELRKVPNIPADDVPLGKDESENVAVRSWGEPKHYSFKARDHMELGELLSGIDTKKASKISGARFNYLLGDVALLEFALINYAMSVLSSEEILKSIAEKAGIEISTKPFIPVVPPVMIRPEIFEKMARKDPEDERYYLPKDELFLIGSAEHTLGPLHMDETIMENQLPIRYVGFSTAFRREAGSYGKDTHGILRVHQFDKVEMETFTLPEDSIKEQNFIITIQEYLMQSLEIPYRVMMICTGDMSIPDARQVDIESWMPSQNKYRETHTADLMTDYQARRLNTKVKRKEGSTEFVHMNDATAFAVGRTIIAILENYQQEDGSIVVPGVLRKFVGKDTLTPQK